jgi:hypothetical protein
VTSHRGNRAQAPSYLAQPYCAMRATDIGCHGGSHGMSSGYRMFDFTSVVTRVVLASLSIKSGPKGPGNRRWSARCHERETTLDVAIVIAKQLHEFAAQMLSGFFVLGS